MFVHEEKYTGRSVEDNVNAVMAKVEEAKGEAQRFLSVYEQYAKAPEVTRKRLFLETMEAVLADSNKIIMESGKDGTGVVPYLPLPEVNKRSKESK